ncbi:hypothetical protein Y032_0557g3403 [Ancylostoma ceylanicum]|uniref:Uncharacterized protein n=1 Tax=Ancylostoma ceylanicum TaxID=53326 RepID=A0A016WQ41_9BILA|nr:hypothetical protein Y032_0557g3403 [Ancylostoma ceylanicum]
MAQVSCHTWNTLRMSLTQPLLFGRVPQTFTFCAQSSSRRKMCAFQKYATFFDCFQIRAGIFLQSLVVFKFRTLFFQSSLESFFRVRVCQRGQLAVLCRLVQAIRHGRQPLGE